MQLVKADVHDKAIARMVKPAETSALDRAAPSPFGTLRVMPLAASRVRSECTFDESSRQVGERCRVSEVLDPQRACSCDDVVHNRDSVDRLRGPPRLSNGTESIYRPIPAISGILAAVLDRRVGVSCRQRQREHGRCLARNVNRIRKKSVESPHCRGDTTADPERRLNRFLVNEYGVFLEEKQCDDLC